MITPTMLRELRSLRLKLVELAKQDEEALAAERRICEARLALAEAAGKLRKPLEACLLDLGYPPVVAGKRSQQRRRAQAQRSPAPGPA